MNNIIFKTTFLKGEDGNNILRIDKTATSGLVDTYTITLTDGTTTTFNVTNGSSIATIEKTATSGLVDTYTITLTDGSTSTFEVTNGGNITVDDHLDANSTNPVQNKIVTGAINNANNYDNTTSGLTATTKQGAIDELALGLVQTSITVGGITMDTIDEKLNFLCNGGGNDKLMLIENINDVFVTQLIETNQLPIAEINKGLDPSSSSDTRNATYIYATFIGQGNWVKIDIYAKNTGKYAVKGFSTAEDNVVTVNANSIIISVATATGHNLPVLPRNGVIATIQYLGNN